MGKVKFSAIMREHFDEIVDKMIEMDAERRKYPIDLYIYPDGHLEEFTNIDGVSYLEDDHYKVWSINNECNDFDMDDDEYLFLCQDNRETYENTLNDIIDEQEREEKYADEFGWN